jgi:hydroxypyruvate reductase
MTKNEAMNEVMRLRNDLWQITRAALQAVNPEVCLRHGVALKCGQLVVEGRGIELSRIARVIVVGMGKASACMAAVLEGMLGDRISAGLIVTADGYSVPTTHVEVVEAGHPIPDERGLAAAKRITSLVTSAGEEDLVIVLISGGGSALFTLPAEGITLSDLAHVNELLLRSGATIEEINTVRKHLSWGKGGQLARRASPARVLSLIISDVPGDALGSIASGPTAPDPSTYGEAKQILERYNLWTKVPAPVRTHIEEGLRSTVPETPKHGDPVFQRVWNVIVGSGTLAAKAAQAEGERLGYRTQLLTTSLEGEAREVGETLASLAREVVHSGRPIQPPALILAAGETTVTVRGDGKGGRNQELALSAALGIAELPDVVIASLGTDGRDGPTDAAGGMVDGDTIARLRAEGIDPERALANNNAYSALQGSGDLIVTGPTGTNVADLCFVMVGPTASETPKKT